MGTVNIVRSTKASNMMEAFRKLQDEAEGEYGNDTYNGEINNCNLIGDWTDKLKPLSENKRWAYIMDHTGKRDAVGVMIHPPVLNTNKIKTEVKNFPQKGARKFETFYVGYVGLAEPEEVVCDKSQTVAITKARAYAEKHPEHRVRIYCEKRLIEGVAMVAEVTYKASTKESPGVYRFYAQAPE